jgi:hypothetical protein
MAYLKTMSKTAVFPLLSHTALSESGSLLTLCESRSTSVFLSVFPYSNHGSSNSFDGCKTAICKLALRESANFS